jgi:hypothetical protein
MLDGGLVNSRDRSLLRPGELARANNCYHKPENPALYKHRGRAAYSATQAQAVLGLKYMEFDSITARLVQVRSTGAAGVLSVSPFTAETGTWTDFADAIAIPTGLDSVYFQDRHVLLIGANTTTGDLLGRNLAFLGNNTVRRHGLAPVVSPPALALVTGSWPNNEDFPLGWYFFITTEVTDESGETAPYFLESAWEGETFAAINVNSTANSVQVTFPAQTNLGQYGDTATGIIQARRVYMAGPIGEIDPVQVNRPPNPPLSLFKLVAQAPIGQASTVVGAVTLQNFNVPGTASGTATNPNNAKVDDGVNTTFATGQTLDTSNYGLAVSGVVTGIRVEIKYKAVTSNISVGICKAVPTVIGTAKTLLINSASYKIESFGGDGDLFGSAPGTYTAADVNAATFGVHIVATSAISLSIDYVRIQVFSTSGVNNIPFGQLFPFITIPISGGTTVLYPSNSEPPTASTGDVFEGQMVLNDVDKPGEIVYSQPDRPEYFPKPYRMRIDPKHRDVVTCVRTLGEVVLIGMQKCLWKINKLPREEDSFFETGRIKNEISPDKGVVNTNAIATFSTPGRPILAAFVSLNGIHYTDGYNVDTLIAGIDWYGMVNADRLSSCWLVNYPKEHLLVFGYVPAGDESSTRPTKRLILHYHPSQTLEGGKLKVTGPIDLAAAAGAPAFLANKHIFVTGHTNGATYVEDRGWQDAAAANANLIMSIVTRDMCPTGVGMQATVERVWWRHGRFTDPDIILTVTPWIKKTRGDYITPASGQRWTGKSRDASMGANLSNDQSTLSNTGAFERTDQHFGPMESFCLEAATSDTNQGFSLAYFALDIAGKGFSDNPG